MPYSPVDPLGLIQGLTPTADPFADLWAEHNDIYAEDAPIIDHVFFETVPDGATNSKLFTWRVRGNYDLHPIVVRIYAEATGGTATLIATCGGVTDTASVTVAAWHTLTLTPTVSGVAVVEIAYTAPAACDLAITRFQCRIDSDAPGIRLASGFVRRDSGDTHAVDEPIASEHMTRLLGGPIHVARNFPRCVGSHVVRRTLAGGAKSVGNWQGYNSTAWESVGLLEIPRVSTRPRPYVIDVFTSETTEGASQAEITIGGIDWVITDLGGTSGKWHTRTINLSPGPHTVRASVLPGASNYARICTFQAWRARESY